MAYLRGIAKRHRKRLIYNIVRSSKDLKTLEAECSMDLQLPAENSIKDLFFFCVVKVAQMGGQLKRKDPLLKGVWKLHLFGKAHGLGGPPMHLSYSRGAVEMTRLWSLTEAVGKVNRAAGLTKRWQHLQPCLEEPVRPKNQRVITLTLKFEGGKHSA